MGISIEWAGSEKNTTASANTLKSELTAYIMGTNRKFLADLKSAENAFLNPSKPQYPEENLDKMYDFFEKELKDILNSNLEDFIRALPQDKYGDLFARITEAKTRSSGERREREINLLSGKKVKDLKNSSFLNKVVGLGALQYGREMEGIPKFDIEQYDEFDIVLDVLLSNTKGENEEEKEFAGKFKLTTKNADNNAVITYPDKSEDTLADDKRQHLERQGIFNPQISSSNKRYKVAEGTFKFQSKLTPEDIFREGKGGFVTVLESGRERVPTMEEEPALAALIAGKTNNKLYKDFQKEGKEFIIKDFESGVDLTNLMAGEIESAYKNKRAEILQEALSILEDSKIVGKAIVEMDIVNLTKSKTKSLSQIIDTAEKARETMIVTIGEDGEINKEPLPTDKKAREKKLKELEKEVGIKLVTTKQVDELQLDVDTDQMDKMIQVEKKNIADAKKQIRSIKGKMKRRDIELKDYSKEEIKKVKEQLKELMNKLTRSEFSKEMNYKNIVNFTKPLANIEGSKSPFIYQPQAHAFSGEASTIYNEYLEEMSSLGEVSVNTLLEKIYPRVKRELQLARRTKKEEGAKIKEKLELLSELMMAQGAVAHHERKKKMFEQIKENDLVIPDEFVNLFGGGIGHQGGEQQAFGADVKVPFGRDDRFSGKILSSFVEDWTDNLEISYETFIQEISKFDLNPFRGGRGMGRAFDQDALIGLKEILTRIERIDERVGSD